MLESDHSSIDRSLLDRVLSQRQGTKLYRLPPRQMDPVGFPRVLGYFPAAMADDTIAALVNAWSEEMSFPPKEHRKKLEEITTALDQIASA